MRGLPLVLPLALALFCPSLASAQATCVDGTGMACLNIVRAARADGVVDDIFETRDHHFAPELHYGTLMPFGGPTYCLGAVTARTSISGSVCCTSGDGTCLPTGTAAEYFAALDWFWVAGVRTHADGSQVADGEPGFYEPTRAFIFDLGAEANRVVVFPITDHPPLPCEAFEYTVWLSNDPHATVIAPPTAPDPAQWNEARLIRVFTQGWTRNPAANGNESARPDLTTFLRDTAGGDALGDGLTTVWGLPCGLSFRYVSVQAGNNGNPGAVCAFHSSENELDAVAGLNEDDTAICVDADGDGHRAASCGGSDCDDTDAMVHPGAFEPCDATRDLDCLPLAACPLGTRCDTQSGLCATACFEGACADGDTCTSLGLCTDAACAARTEPCAAGTICRDGACVAPCDGVTCPAGRLCISGACIDPCQGVVCPSMQVCIAGRPGARTLCGPACTCTDLGTTSLCSAPTVCDARTGSDTAGLCVDPGCDTATCAAGRVCIAGTCADACAGVACPLGQTCTLGECVVDTCASVRCTGGLVCRAGACVDPCTGVTCSPTERCRAGACEPDPCAGVDCGASATCVAGTCVATDAGRSAMDAATHDSGRRGTPPSNAGCGCRAAGRGQGVGWTLALAVVLVLSRRVGSQRRAARR